jgi:hypothetical protein
LKDVKRVGRLMAEVITALDEEFLQGIAWKRKEDEKSEDDD